MQLKCIVNLKRKETDQTKSFEVAVMVRNTTVIVMFDDELKKIPQKYRLTSNSFFRFYDLPKMGF